MMIYVNDVNLIYLNINHISNDTNILFKVILNDFKLYDFSSQLYARIFQKVSLIFFRKKSYEKIN